MIRVGGFFAIHDPEKFLEEMNKKKVLNCLRDMDMVELWIEHPYGNSELIEKNEFFDALLDILDERVVGIHAPILISNLLNPNRALEKGTIKEYEATIKLAKKLNAEYVVLHAGAYPFFLDEEHAKNIILKRLKSLAVYARRNGTQLAVENVPYGGEMMIQYGAKLSEIRHLLDNVPDLKFVLDVPHLLFSGENEIIIDKLHIERLVCLHLHDTDGREDHIEIGKGIIQHEDVLKSVLAEKEDLLINVEVVGIEKMHRSIKKVKKIVKKIISQ